MTAPVQHPLPTLDMDVLRTFAAIADTGSFSAAANVVFRTPSAVSMQIKKLEDQLGVAVFERDARSVTLTSDGEVLLGYARRLLALNREAVAKFVAPAITGVVRLGSPDDIGECILPLVLKRFAETHPGVTVDVVIDQSTNLRKRLDERRLDVTLVNLSHTVPSKGDTEVLLDEELVWAGAKCGTAYRRDPLPLSIWEEGCAWRGNALEALENSGRPYRIAYMSSHSTGQRAAIQADLAIAPFGKTLLGEGIVALGPEHGLPELGRYQLGMLIRPDARQHIQVVADHLRSVFESYRRTGRFETFRSGWGSAAAACG
ncbi:MULTISPECIES: LysR family transcriptional regulator [Brucella/Ochrobactrum group]|uniref:LysR family transcriptional regulator n=1 Tax=Brucella/Ochrobactrum group TaxID=2826938 RepID=UPI00165618CD|nr:MULTISPECIES: LysR family transcriptional regulator [Brucella/Ochrobactrum group]MBC8717184.1 LysR family transcriptional regulator [Ochrobactrum sp. Marseille-Q0166]